MIVAKDPSLVTAAFKVLLAIDSNQHLTIEEIAQQIGNTPRNVQRIVGELETFGYLRIEKKGRNNRYWLNYHKRLVCGNFDSTVGSYVGAWGDRANGDYCSNVSNDPKPHLARATA